MIELPSGFSELRTINLQKNLKLAVLVNLLSLVLMAGLFYLGTLFVPFAIVIKGADIGSLLLGLGGFLLAILLYVVGHELVHGVFMKKLSGHKPKYGFTVLYAYAGSDAYFPKRDYIIIALAPVVVFGALFLLLNILLPAAWFWPVYILQIINISGAAGDFYVTALMTTLPGDVLTRDSGIEMTMYSKTPNA